MPTIAEFMARDQPESLCVPHVSGMTCAKAAVEYAKAGFVIVPIDPATKNAGSLLHEGWTGKASRSPDMARIWWQEHPNAGIGIVTGHSGLVVFDLDTDEIPAELAFLKTGAIHLTRPGGSQRGHYVFRSREIFTSGKVVVDGQTVGEIRSGNTIFVVEPTPHSKAGLYRWDTSYPIPELPTEALDYLTAKSTRAVGGSVSEFIASNTGNECPHLKSLLANGFQQKLAETGNVHDAMFYWLCVAFKESAAQGYPASEAESLLRNEWMTAIADRPTHNETEFDDMLPDAVEAALADDHENRRKRMRRDFGTDTRTATNDFVGSVFDRSSRQDQPNVTADEIDAQAVADLDTDDFWTATPVLRDIRQFARARRVGPYAMLGNVLTLATSAIPPHVVLPPERGSHASLNLFVALVGPSGATKSISMASARDWITVDPMVDASKPGSGEGLAKCFAYVRTSKTQAPTQVGKAWSVIAVIPEVETLLATGGRSGSTMMSEFRSGWSGERLGHDFSDQTKVVVLKDHRYRLCYVIGVQPKLAKGLFDGADAGTPQRILWLPTSDPNRTRNRPDEPATYKLDAWPEPVPVKAGVSPNLGRLQLLNQRADRSSFELLELPQIARDAIDEEAFTSLGRGLVDDSENGHRILSQLKTAASLMFLHKRTRQITELDWELAGHLLNVSDRLRLDTRNLISNSAFERKRSEAVSQGMMADVVESAKEQRAFDRIAKNLVKHLESAPMGTMPRNDLRKRLPSRDRSHFDVVLSKLVDDNVVDVYPSRNKGPDGSLVALMNRD